MKNWIKYSFFAGLITLLVVTPDLVFLLKNRVYNYAFASLVVVFLLLLIPVVLFSRRLKIYYGILSIIIALTPIMLLPIFFMNIQVNTEMVGLVLETHTDEVWELLGYKIIFLVAGMLLFGWGSYQLSKQLPSQIRWKHGLMVTIFGTVGFLAIPLIRSNTLKKFKEFTRNTYLTYYPFRMFSAFDLILSQQDGMQEYAERTKNFQAGVSQKTPGDTTRKIYVMVIGETSRYDHWGVNGYERNTSPRMQTLPNLFAFKNAVSGATMTILSVPQLITSAEPRTFDEHRNEKSILAVFKEAGYYTAWISNQSKYGLAGNIGMHFHDGDTAMFCGYGANENNFTSNLDDELVVKMKKIIDEKPHQDLFFILHMIGSHWRYLLRYPETMEPFKPTYDRHSVVLERPTQEQLINEYDNSIHYSDYILGQIADVLNQSNAKSSFVYVSDHGEHLNDNNNSKYFHSFTPFKVTAKVPLFIWFNDQYAKTSPEVLTMTKNNLEQKVSTGVSVYHSMLSIAGLQAKCLDSTKVLTNKFLKPSDQAILGENNKIYFYKDIE